MGKFAGFLKRAKRLAGICMNVLNTFNDIYKGVKQFVEPIVGTLQFGGHINKYFCVSSKTSDKIQQFTNE